MAFVKLKKKAWQKYYKVGKIWNRPWKNWKYSKNICISILFWFLFLNKNDFWNNYLNRNSLTQTAASASTKRSNLFIHMQPEFKAAGTSLMAKLQIQRFIKPLQLVSFQFEYLGQIPLVVSFSKSEKKIN